MASISIYSLDHFTSIAFCKHISCDMQRPRAGKTTVCSTCAGVLGGLAYIYIISTSWLQVERTQHALHSLCDLGPRPHKLRPPHLPTNQQFSTVSRLGSWWSKAAETSFRQRQSIVATKPMPDVVLIQGQSIIRLQSLQLLHNMGPLSPMTSC